MPYEELKERHSAMWGSGPYQRVTDTIADIHERVVERLDPQPGTRWLDLACGTGAVAERAAARGVQVTGVDLAPALIETARERAGELGLDIDYRVGDCERLELPDASFDTVVAMHLVSVVPEPERVVAEMARVCRPGGEVLILNHFLHEKGPLAATGRALAPLADQLGWHSDFPLARVLGEPSLDLVEQVPSPPLGMFTRLRLRKRAA